MFEGRTDPSGTTRHLVKERPLDDLGRTQRTRRVSDDVACHNAVKVLMLAPDRSMHSRRPLWWLLERGYEVVFVGDQDPLPSARPGYRFVRQPGIRGTRLLR